MDRLNGVQVEESDLQFYSQHVTVDVCELLDVECEQNLTFSISIR